MLCQLCPGNQPAKGGEVTYPFPPIPDVPGRMNAQILCQIFLTRHSNDLASHGNRSVSIPKIFKVGVQTQRVMIQTVVTFHHNSAFGVLEPVVFVKMPQNPGLSPAQGGSGQKGEYIFPRQYVSHTGEIVRMHKEVQIERFPDKWIAIKMLGKSRALQRQDTDPSRPGLFRHSSQE